MNLGKKTQLAESQGETTEKGLFHIRKACSFQKEEEQKDLGRVMILLCDIFS